uniref:Probable ribosome biogenesis protein RLP24 n=1 Tax=Piliocolobus tephrosceles TaxID=591936 RepID=A0A8C9GHH2_9PRIM
MRIEKCWFCSANIYPGHGIVFIRNDANVFRFCSSKCNKHFKAKHNPRKVKWTKVYRKERKKELCSDSIFEFEKIRNEPTKYDRDLYIKTISTMKTIDKIKEKRKMQFYKNRIKEIADKKINLSINYIKKNPLLLKDTEFENVLNDLVAQKNKQKDIGLIQNTFEKEDMIITSKDIGEKVTSDMQSISDYAQEQQRRQKESNMFDMA